MASKVSRRALLTGAAGLAALGPSVARGRTRSTTVTGGLDVERFVEDVKRANRGGQQAVDEVLARAVSEPGRVLAGLGEPTEAGLKVLYSGADVTILNVVWAPLMVLLPHNHNMWASIGIYTGREDNIVWKRQGSTIEAYKAASLSDKEIFGLNRNGIHSVINPIRRLTGAIHIYGGDFFAPGRSEWDPEKLAQRPFDVDALRKNFREANERFKSGKP